MYQWVLVLIALIVIVALIIVSMVKDKRSGKSTCGHGCQNCAMHGQCHKMADKNSKND